ncbi:MAG: hypothetical protein LBU73_07700 [Helicobacteraceae bacterium]|jgi:hypothetical protein|nr:hypothetical protein [Helicobacteraceae bacterium]
MSEYQRYRQFSSFRDDERERLFYGIIRNSSAGAIAIDVCGGGIGGDWAYTVYISIIGIIVDKRGGGCAVGIQRDAEKEEEEG